MTRPWPEPALVFPHSRAKPVVSPGKEKHTRPAQFSPRGFALWRKRSGKGMLRRWSGQRDSNSLPPPWQGGALPNELCPHIQRPALRPGPQEEGERRPMRRRSGRDRYPPDKEPVAFCFPQTRLIYYHRSRVCQAPPPIYFTYIWQGLALSHSVGNTSSSRKPRRR